MERADRERYARHLLLPQVGEAGQQRLLQTVLRAESTSEVGALAVARHYLARAGVRMAEAAADVPALRVASTARVERVAGDPALLPAARALLGALAAVDAIRDALSLPGQRQELDELTLAAQPAGGPKEPR